jgi:hypothetical protein
MSGDYSGFVAILDAQRRIRAQIEYGDPREDGPSRIRQAAAALGQRFTSIVKYARQKPERFDAAMDPRLCEAVVVRHGGRVDGGHDH